MAYRVVVNYRTGQPDETLIVSCIEEDDLAPGIATLHKVDGSILTMHRYYVVSTEEIEG